MAGSFSFSFHYRSLAAAVAGALVELHAPTGQIIDINPAYVSSMRAPLDTSGRWARGVRCIIVMANGRFNAVAEDCDTVREKMK